MLKANYQILEDRIRDEDLFILLQASAGMYGCRQLEVLSFTNQLTDPDNIPSWYYHSEIYGSLSELLDLAEKDIQEGKKSRGSEGRCHRCMEPVYEGENNIETWLISGGRLFLYSREGKINIEARNCAEYKYTGLYFFVTGESLGDALSQLDQELGQYDLLALREYLGFHVVSDKEEIQKQLSRTKK